MAFTTPTMTTTDILKVSILGKESIHAGFHLIPHIVHTVLTTLPSSTYVLITDSNIAKLHLHAFENAFTQSIDTNANNTASQPRFLSHVITPGETSKSRDGKASIEDVLLFHKCTRDTVILALGGGVIGDLVGFVAATFMRGVRFCQIPTTLLAMVDSSVGGKTAIDTPHGKNLIGAFWQPEYIFIDAAFLETLPTREFSNGMAEVVKTAAIWNEQEFISLESRPIEIFTAIQTPSKGYAGRTKSTRSAAQDLLLSVIVGSISVKAYIVTIDERETGLRNLVNFGHTIGHAIEAVLTPTILHGECVSIGMILEAEVSRQLGILGQVGVGRLTRCLKGYNLPISLSDPRISALPQAKLLTVEKLLDVMKIDKKNSGAEKKVVLLKRIGETYEQKATGVKDEVIKKTLAEAATIVPGIPKKEGIVMSTPGSKSISNRVLVLAALGEGTCRLKNLLHSDDTQVMMVALAELKGAVFSWEDGGETLVVEGGKGSLSVPQVGKELYLQNAGTAARFLTTVCALVQSTLPSASSERTIITGNARMKQRPIGPLVTALQANGSQITYLESEGCLPLAIAPNGLKGGRIQLAASVSSQYVSSILLCAPYAVEPITLELVGGQVISQPYIDMTIAMMATFGIRVVRRVDPADPTGQKLLDIYDIPKGTYKNPGVYEIESDASSATYPLAVAAITGTKCTIANIGSGSLQGDARFAIEVLEKMGCSVEQSLTSTTVQGPPVVFGRDGNVVNVSGGLKAIEEVDMTVMTDAFLTATVLGAVAQGKTRILGIANQRVKECNRIRAMIDELAKFGVDCNELPDGLEVIGKPISELKKGVSVHCYDDHRVAMAFSVLSCVVEGVIIEEKRCVEKTWPNWWDDLENKIGIKVQGVDLAAIHSDSASSSTLATAPTSDASIVLTGMRGTGKTHIGNLAASALGWTFVDADHYFEEKLSIGVREFVHQKGWEEFRATELSILKDLLDPSSPTSRKHVISLGGGVVETAAARDVLKAYVEKWGGSVVQIVRPLEEVVNYLESETARPAYGEPVADVFKRREVWYKECANLDFVNPVGGGVFAALQGGNGVGVAIGAGGQKGIRAEVERFFKHVTGQQSNFTHTDALGPKHRSYFLCLTYPDVRQAFPYIDGLTEGADALELRVDLLKSSKNYESIGDVIPSVEYVEEQVAALRRATSLPIIFTVRTKSQGGAFPDSATKEALELLNLGLRLGVEYLDVEISLPHDGIEKLVKRKNQGRSTKIIASWHDWSGRMKWDGEDVKAKYEQAKSVGDLIKIVGKAEKVEDNFKLREFVGRVEALEGAKPVVAINMGGEGQLSRILNATFTPVSHPLLPNKAAPGQLSFKQIQRALHLVGLLPSKKFYLFGTPIAYSMSPTLHNTGFEILGLPHRYELLETKDVGEEIKIAIASPDFGGASVTIPFKLDIMPLLDGLTEAAKVIGAVNTIIPQASVTEKGAVEGGKGHSLVGDNTDWVGIKLCITQTVAQGEIRAGLVIGAGGTARAAIWALMDLGAPIIYLYNRTQSKAEELKAAFEGKNDKKTKIEVLASLDSGWKDASVAPNVVIGTVPASATIVASHNQEGVTGNAPDGIVAGVQLPASIFQYRDGPAVVVDMAYKPVETPLLKLARIVGAGAVGSIGEIGGIGARGNWECVPGLEVLLKQGYVQFEKWTGRKCPKEQVWTRVWEKYNAQA